MGKKKENIHKGKECGNKVQDQNMANVFEYEITLQVQEGNKVGYGSTSSDQEIDDETFEELQLVRGDGKNVATKSMRNKYNALLEFRSRVEDSILGNYLLGEPTEKVCTEGRSDAIEQLQEISLWGVPLSPSKRHKGTDVVLLKFLRAKDYKVQEAFEMLRETLKWRKEFKVDGILEENLGLDLQNLGYLNGRDKEGHPLFYNIYGALKDKQKQYQLLGSEENRQRFLRWRVQYMEKAIKELEFEAGRTNSIVQIIDMNNSTGPATKELQSVCRESWKLFQDHYPELIHLNIIINVPLWYYISHAVSSRLKTHRKNSKIVIARPGKVTSTLLRFIPPENLPVEYEGLKRENDDDFSVDDMVEEVNVRATSSENIQIPAPKTGVTMVWDIMVVGSWDVSYKEEFIPDDEGSYKVLLGNEKERKKERGSSTGRNSYYISEPGKIVISLHNSILKKTRVLYRFKTKPTLPAYLINK